MTKKAFPGMRIMGDFLAENSSIGQFLILLIGYCDNYYPIASRRKD
jgi:hypothetical protein